jgi:hypothetical protein
MQVQGVCWALDPPANKTRAGSEVSQGGTVLTSGGCSHPQKRREKKKRKKKEKKVIVNNCDEFTD